MAKHDKSAEHHASDDVNQAAGAVSLKPEAAAPKAVEKKEKEAGPKLPKNVAPTQVVRLLSDKDGKSYSAEHNPKRPGSKAASRFALYKDGMSVKEALDAGLQGNDLSYDIAKGFIKLEGDAPLPTPEAA